MTCEGGLGRQAPKSAELDSEWEDSDFPTRRGSRETLVLSGDSFTDILGDGRQTKGRRPAGTKKNILFERYHTRDQDKFPEKAPGFISEINGLSKTLVSFFSSFYLSPGVKVNLK